MAISRLFLNIFPVPDGLSTTCRFLDSIASPTSHGPFRIRLHHPYYTSSTIQSDSTRCGTASESLGFWKDILCCPSVHLTMMSQHPLVSTAEISPQCPHRIVTMLVISTSSPKSPGFSAGQLYNQGILLHPSPYNPGIWCRRCPWQSRLPLCPGTPGRALALSRYTFRKYSDVPRHHLASQYLLLYDTLFGPLIFLKICYGLVIYHGINILV